MKFTKAHGIGNDFIIVAENDVPSDWGRLGHQAVRSEQGHWRRRGPGRRDRRPEQPGPDETAQSGRDARRDLGQRRAVRRGLRVFSRSASGRPYRCPAPRAASGCGRADGAAAVFGGHQSRLSRAKCGQRARGLWRPGQSRRSRVERGRRNRPGDLLLNGEPAHRRLRAGGGGRVPHGPTGASDREPSALSQPDQRGVRNRDFAARTASALLGTGGRGHPGLGNRDRRAPWWPRCSTDARTAK